jgi:hypothetical protein
LILPMLFGLFEHRSPRRGSSGGTKLDGHG